MIEEYIKQLSEDEKKVYKIAKEHLGSSFDIEKSIGYKKWLKKVLPKALVEQKGGFGGLAP